MCPSHANLKKKENCCTMKNSARRYPQPRHDNCESPWKNRRKKCFHNSMGKGRNKIRLEDALLVKSAEYWLKLGEPIQALMELQQVTGEQKERCVGRENICFSH